MEAYFYVPNYGNNIYEYIRLGQIQKGATQGLLLSKLREILLPMQLQQQVHDTQ